MEQVPGFEPIAQLYRGTASYTIIRMLTTTLRGLAPQYIVYRLPTELIVNDIGNLNYLYDIKISVSDISVSCTQMIFIGIILNDFYLTYYTVFSITIDLDYKYKVTETPD